MKKGTKIVGQPGKKLVKKVDKNGKPIKRWTGKSPAAASAKPAEKPDLKLVPPAVNSDADVNTDTETKDNVKHLERVIKYPRDYKIIVDRSAVVTPDYPHSPGVWLKAHPDLDVKTNEWLGDEQRIAEEEERVAKWGGKSDVRDQQGVVLGQWQGERVYVVEHKPTGKYAVVVSSYGSCSGCDAWQAAMEEDYDVEAYGPEVPAPAAEILADKLYSSLKFYEPETLVNKLEEEFADPKDADNPEWYHYDDEYTTYMKQVVLPALRTRLNI